MDNRNERKNINYTIFPLKMMMDTNIPNTEPFEFTSSNLYHPTKSITSRLGKYPLFTYSVKYPSILSKWDYSRITEFFFDATIFKSILVGYAGDIIDFKTDDDGEKKREVIEYNIKYMLSLLFPITFPYKRYIEDSYNKIILGKSSFLIDGDFIYNFLFQLDNKYSYIKHNGKVMTITNAIFVNDVFNHPKYKKMVEEYDSLKKVIYKKTNDLNEKNKNEIAKMEKYFRDLTLQYLQNYDFFYKIPDENNQSEYYNEYEKTKYIEKNKTVMIEENKNYTEEINKKNKEIRLKNAEIKSKKRKIQITEPETEEEIESEQDQDSESKIKKIETEIEKMKGKIKKIESEIKNIKEKTETETKKKEIRNIEIEIEIKNIEIEIIKKKKEIEVIKSKIEDKKKQNDQINTNIDVSKKLFSKIEMNIKNYMKKINKRDSRMSLDDLNKINIITNFLNYFINFINNVINVDKKFDNLTEFKKCLNESCIKKDNIKSDKIKEEIENYYPIIDVYEKFKDVFSDDKFFNIFKNIMKIVIKYKLTKNINEFFERDGNNIKIPMNYTILDDITIKEMNEFLPEYTNFVKSFDNYTKKYRDIQDNKELQKLFDTKDITTNDNLESAFQCIDDIKKLNKKKEDCSTTLDFNVGLCQITESNKPFYEIYIMMDVVEGEINDSNVSMIKCNYKDYDLGSMFYYLTIGVKNMEKYALNIPYLRIYKTLDELLQDNKKKMNAENPNNNNKKGGAKIKWNTKRRIMKPKKKTLRKY